MQQARLIRLPVHVVRELTKVLRARRTLEAAASGQGPVTAEDIAGLIGRPVDEVAELLRLAQQPKYPTPPNRGWCKLFLFI